MTTTPMPEARPATHTGPCEPWPLDLSCTDCRDLVTSPGESPSELTDAIERWSLIATQLLWRWSGMRWGALCPVTVRPCLRSCLDDAGLFPYWPAAGTPWTIPYIDSSGIWRNATPCGCTPDCSCTELCEIRLDGPVYDILQVTIDGEVLPPEAYRVDAANRLVRVDGGCWDRCQDMSLPPTEPNTFSVTYRIGLHLDETAIAAVSELTCELLKACGALGDSCGQCRLPSNVSRVTRQGVTVESLAMSGLFAEGKTGLPIVDAWIQATNPNRLPMASRVLSPDYKRPRMRWL